MCHIFSLVWSWPQLNNPIIWRHRGVCNSPLPIQITKVWLKSDRLKNSKLFFILRTNCWLHFGVCSLWVNENISFSSSHISSVAPGCAPTQSLGRTLWVSELSRQWIMHRRLSLSVVFHPVSQFIQSIFHSILTSQRWDIKALAWLDILQHANCWWYACDLSSSKCKTPRRGSEYMSISLQLVNRLLCSVLVTVELFSTAQSLMFFNAWIIYEEKFLKAKTRWKIILHFSPITPVKLHFALKLQFPFAVYKQ